MSTVAAAPFKPWHTMTAEERRQEVLKRDREDNAGAYRIYRFTDEEKNTAERLRQAVSNVDMQARELLPYRTNCRALALQYLQMAGFYLTRAIGENRDCEEKIQREEERREAMRKELADKAPVPSQESIDNAVLANAEDAKPPVPRGGGSATASAGVAVRGDERTADAQPQGQPQPADQNKE